MRDIFAPGCALFIYKPHLVESLSSFLASKYEVREKLLTCCHFTPELPDGARVINICPGCDRRYRENYARPSTISLWELLAGDDDFPFPDYCGEEMTVIDACPTRDQDRIHDAVRALARRMNITVVEPEKTGKKSTCCGDTFWGKLPTGKVMEQMKTKASSMPIGDIIVYCVSCSKSMFIGGRQPRYLVDLLFGEETVAGTFHPEQWHAQLDEFMEAHTGYEGKPTSPTAGR